MCSKIHETNDPFFNLDLFILVNQLVLCLPNVLFVVSQNLPKTRNIILYIALHDAIICVLETNNKQSIQPGSA